MANFSNLITTSKGHELITAILAGKIEMGSQSPFTKIVTSSAVHQLSELEGLLVLDEVHQETLVSDVAKQNQTTVTIHGSLDNSTLAVGYRLNTVGVYFLNPADGVEYLFGAAIHQPTTEAPNADFVFPFNGLTTTGLIFDLFASVGNADNISLNVNPAATVTVQMLSAHNNDPDAHAELVQKVLGLISEGGDVGNLITQALNAHKNDPDAHTELMQSIIAKIDNGDIDLANYATHSDVATAIQCAIKSSWEAVY